MPFNDEHRRQYRKGLFATREFWIGSLVVLVGILLAYSLALRFVS